MSWIAALSGPDVPADVEWPSRVFTPLYIARTPFVRVAIGGIHETCHFEHREADSSGWAVVGTGIRLVSGRASILTTDDWRQILLSDRPLSLGELDGHLSWWPTFEMWRQPMSRPGEEWRTSP